MLEIQQIRNRAEEIAQALERKGLTDAMGSIQEILSTDESRREVITSLENLRQSANQSARSIGQLMKEGKKEEAEAAKAKAAAAKQGIKELEEKQRSIEAEVKELLLALPNTPHPSVPTGKTPEDNDVVYQNDVKVTFDFDPKPHWDLAVHHGIIDWELGVKITGAGFPLYVGKGARLQRALINWFLDRAREAGYTEYMPPLMVNEASAYGTGQLPDKDSQMYTITADSFYMIPTAEVPITNIYRDVIVEEKDFPIKSCGYTPCFRREAGSYGKDVKGLNRLHQFDKVEVVQIAHPERSYEVLDEMCVHVESLLQDLGLPYRKLLLCSGDMSFTSAKTYDMEVFSAGQERWLEVSSVSNFESYQANRLKLRYRNEDRKTQLAHTLNGSALALPRIMAALIENNQQTDGSIVIPEVLRSYTGFDVI
ncbi:MAG: serine--tRNA ligase [Bacteroidota bacterium]